MTKTEKTEESRVYPRIRSTQNSQNPRHQSATTRFPSLTCFDQKPRLEQMLAAHSRLVSKPTPVKERSPAWKEILEAVDPFLQSVAGRLLLQAQQFEPDIACYAQYALGAQGKQLRPLLVSLSGQSVGALDDSHITAAVIVEMVHLATLVHDDVIDEAKLRRGQTTAAAKWGNELSVLLGDCLFARAVELAASFPTPEICRNVASATNTVCAGEILQSKARGDFEMSLPHYYKILSMKTAELFALSCDLGGFLAQANPVQRKALKDYGMALGTAYQLYDDCLDLLGSESNAGKTLGADLGKGKLTLPILIVRDRASGGEREQLRQWIEKWDQGFLPQLLGLMSRHGALHQSRAVVQEYLGAASQALLALPEGEGRAALSGLTEYLAQQTEALGVI